MAKCDRGLRTWDHDPGAKPCQRNQPCTPNVMLGQLIAYQIYDRLTGFEQFVLLIQLKETKDATTAKTWVAYLEKLEGGATLQAVHSSLFCKEVLALP